MKIRFRIGAGMLLCIVLLGWASIAAAQQAGDVVADRYIVQLKSGVAPGKILTAHGLKPDFVYESAVHGFAGFVPAGEVRNLKKDSSVLSMVPDRVVQAVGKPSASGKPAPVPPPPPQVVPAGVARIGAAPAADALTGQGVGVAIVDTGLDFAHADLPVAGPAASFTAYGSSAQDNNGHGTHVGGIVAAKNNTIDVVGVAPGATLYAVKVLDAKGTGADSAVMAGLDWVAAHAGAVTPPIRIVNMSLGRPGTMDDNPALRTAVRNLYLAGIVVVVAAGNDKTIEVSQEVPAAYPEVLAVASTTAKNGTSAYRAYPAGIRADTASYFTTDGAFSAATGVGVTVSAPGEDEEDISKTGTISSVGILSTKLGGGTVRMSGTSMAAPHVCGVVARLLEATPDAVDVETVRSLIRQNAAGAGAAPLDSPVAGYTFDGQREGVVTVPDLWIAP